MKPECFIRRASVGRNKESFRGLRVDECWCGYRHSFVCIPKESWDDDDKKYDLWKESGKP